MRNRIAFSAIAILLGITFIFAGCHTFVFQPVEKDIQDTWVLMPVESNNVVEWTFDDNELSIEVNGVPVKFEDENGNEIGATTYSIENSITNHYVYIKPEKITNAHPNILPQHIRKWLIITLNDTELFLESINTDSGQKGEFQFHFFR